MAQQEIKSVATALRERVLIALLSSHPALAKQYAESTPAEFPNMSWAAKPERGSADEHCKRVNVDEMTLTTPSPISDQAAGEPNWRTELSRIVDDYQPDGLEAILALEEMRQALRELLESTACDCGVSCQDKGEGNCRYAAPALGIDVEFVKNPVHGGFNIRKWSARGELSEGKFVFYAAPIRVSGSLSDGQAARIFSCAKEWTDEWSERESSGTGINPSAELVNAMFVRTVLSMLRSTAPTTGSAPVAVKAFGTGAQVVIEGTFDGDHAVLILPAKQPGEVGASAKREGPITDDSLADAVVLTFPTAEQVDRVANALVAASRAASVPKPVSELESTEEYLARRDGIAASVLSVTDPEIHLAMIEATKRSRTAAPNWAWIKAFSALLAASMGGEKS